MTDFFGDADYKDVEVREFDPDRYRLGVGKHRVEVTKAEPVDKKDGTQAFIVEYSDADGKTYTHWLNRIEPGDEQKVFGDGSTLVDIKKAERVRILEQLGVAREDIPHFDPDSVVGTAGYLTLFKKGNYIRYGKFEPLQKGLSQTDGISEFVKPAVSATSEAEQKAFGF